LLDWNISIPINFCGVIPGLDLRFRRGFVFKAQTTADAIIYVNATGCDISGMATPFNYVMVFGGNMNKNVNIRYFTQTFGQKVCFEKPIK